MTMTLYRVILHTIVHHSSTSTYMPNFIKIKETFLWVEGRTYRWTDRGTFETDFIRKSRTENHKLLKHNGKI